MEWTILFVIGVVVFGAMAANLRRSNRAFQHVAGVSPALIPLSVAVWQYHAVTGIRQEDYSYVPWLYLWIWPVFWLAITLVAVVAGLWLPFRSWLANSIGTWIRVVFTWRFWGPHNQPFWCLVGITLISAMLTIIQLFGSHTKPQPTREEIGNQVVASAKAAGGYVDSIIMEAMGQATMPAPAPTATPVPTAEKKPYPFRWWWFVITLMGLVISPISGVLVYRDDLVDHLRGALELLKLRKGEAEAVPAVSEDPGLELARRHGAVAPITPSHGLGWGYWTKHVLANFAPDWFVNKFIHK